MTDLKTELEELASAIVKEASAQGENSPSFADKVDAIDKLTRLYIAFQKHPAEDDEEDSDFNFDKGVQTPAKQEQPNGSARVHPSPQRRRNTVVS